MHTKRISEKKTSTGELVFVGGTPEIVTRINEAINLSSNLPPDAKKTAKDFIEENIKDILEYRDKLTDFKVKVPESIIEYWTEIVEIIMVVLRSAF